MCDGDDNDCSGAPAAFEVDEDGDGYVACVSWLDTQGNNPEIVGGGDCEPTNASVKPGTPAGACTEADGWSCVAGAPGCVPICGDGLMRGEGCDDGNTQSGDGCDASCVVEGGYGCTGAPSKCRRFCDGGTLSVIDGTTQELVAARASVTGTNAPGATSLNVSSTSGFAAGDEILMVTMVGTGGTCGESGAGGWELNYVTGTGTGVLHLRYGLTRSFTAGGGEVHQVVKVPSYQNVTLGTNAVLTGSEWNGTTGGVLALRAETLAIGAGSKIEMNAKGYRGGISDGTTPGSGAAPEGPTDRVGMGGGSGGKGGNQGINNVGGAGSSGEYNATLGQILGGGGGSGGGNTTVALGTCGGGGGGGPGKNQSSRGGQGAANGGRGRDDNSGSDLRREGAGGGGCPFDSPATCTDRGTNVRFLLGSGSAAGASGGCAEDLGDGGRGGSANGSTRCNSSGTNGSLGGGLVLLLVRTVNAAGAGVEVQGGAGGAGGPGESKSSGILEEGYAGGGGGGGAGGAKGGTVVLVGSTAVGVTLPISVAGGLGGNGGNGGAGTCGSNNSNTKAGGSGGIAATSLAPNDGTNGNENYCGGGGGGGRFGPPGEAGIVYVNGGMSITGAAATSVPSSVDFEPFTCPPR